MVGSKDLLVRILADASALEREMAKAEGATKQTERSFMSMGKTAAIAAGVGGIGLLAVGLDKSVKAALDAQQSTARLDQAFKNVGLSASDSADQIGQAEASARKLGFTDSQTRDALGSLITATHDTGTAMSDLSVAQDIARFKGVDLGNATTMLTTAMTGSQRAAKQLGITVSPVTTAYDALKRSSEDLTTATGKADEAQAKLQDKMATGQAVIQAVTDKVHGQADAFAGTAAGSMEQFRASVDHLEAALGKGLLPKLAEFAQKASDGVTWLDKYVSALKHLDGELAANTTSHVTAANSVAHTGAALDSSTEAAIKSRGVLAFLSAQLKTDENVWGHTYTAIQEVVGALQRFHDWDVKVGNDLVAWAEAVGRFAATISKDILNLVKTVYDDGVAVGNAIVSGIEHGLGDIASSIGHKIGSGLHGAVNTAKGLLGIGSPSKVTAAEIGVPLAQGIEAGFVEGIGNFGNVVSDNLDSQYAAAADRLKNMPGYGKMVGTIRGALAIMPTAIGDINATNAAAATYAQTQQTISDYSSQYLDTQFAGAGYDPTKSAAQIYANQAPTVTGDINVQIDGQILATITQQQLLRTAARNVTAGIN